MKKIHDSGNILLAAIAGLLFFSALFTACTKYRDVPGKYGTFTPPPAGTIAFGTLRINEYICKGTDPGAQTHFGGSTSKWFELYNPTSQDVILTPGQWYVTDTLGIKNKFAIPQNTLSAGAQWKVPAGGFLGIIAVKSSAPTTPGWINASFSLSSTKGAIGIYYQATPADPFIAVDTVLYDWGSGGAASGVTFGHLTDGQGIGIATLPHVTPEASNN